MNLLETLLFSKVPVYDPEAYTFKEQCWLIYGIKTEKYYIGYLSYQGEGTLASVGFDWKKISDKKVLGFYHTHPSGLVGPSDRDDRTMGALVRAEGRPLLCGILAGKINRCFKYHRGSDRTNSGLRDKLVKHSTSIGNTYLKGVKIISILGLKIFIAKRY